MNLGEMWRDLEERLPAGRAGSMVQRVHPESRIDLHVAVSRTGARRSLLLEVVPESVEGVNLPAGTRGIAMALEADEGGDKAILSLDLLDPSTADLFTAVCQDMAAVTAAADTDEAAVGAWLGRFILWQRFLERGAGPLSPRRQRGLYAELWTMRELLAPSVGIQEAVSAWKGPDGAPRDFETSGIAVEAKSSAANEPQVVPVHGERQLDDTELNALFVIHLSLEPLRDAGETLLGIVSTLRDAARGGPSEGQLEDRLLASGYVEVHASAYSRTGYALRRLSVLRVSAGFPRITEADLPDGVGSVRYSLAIDACRDFEVTKEELTAGLGG